LNSLLSNKLIKIYNVTLQLSQQAKKPTDSQYALYLTTRIFKKHNLHLFGGFFAKEFKLPSKIQLGKQDKNQHIISHQLQMIETFVSLPST
jgi:hypothetical protein